MRLLRPDDEAEVRLLAGGAEAVVLDTRQLRATEGDATETGEYGLALGRALLKEGSRIREAFNSARQAAAQRQAVLRVRLFIEPSAPDLHSLRWETLRDPESGDALFANAQIAFSRYLTSADWRPVNLKAAGKLRALVAIANPSDLGTFQPPLAAVDVARELDSARNGLKGIALSELASEGKASLSGLAAALAEGFDILYLVCHGAINADNEAQLWLEKPDRTADVVSGDDLLREVRRLVRPPTLVVLASCQSSGTGKAGDAQRSLAALGPRLVEAGIPAVVAMQGNVKMDTIAEFIPAFFEQLRLDGQIDRAMSSARAAIAKREDFWAPVLYSRLRRGRIWYDPGFTGSESQLTIWDSLADQIKRGAFVPILGPDLDEDLYGGSGEIARQLADKRKFPMMGAERSDLAKVVQFITVDQGRSFAYNLAKDELLTQMWQRNGDFPEATEATAKLKLLAAKRRAIPDDPFSLLADLPARLYVSASPETLLYRVLELTPGKKPEMVISKWKTDSSNHPTPPQVESDPSPKTPLIYHVFGRFIEPLSMVLTEDDFFDYLIAASKFPLMPPEVGGLLAKNSLLFLGFRLNDWTFRVLFRLLMNLGGAGGLQGMPHVGVQVNPDEHSLADVKRARKYLIDYFSSNDRREMKAEPEIRIYWGSAADFLRELKQHLPPNLSPTSVVEDDDV